MDSDYTPWLWGYWSYENPYCVGPVVIDNTRIDYSQPIVLAAPSVDDAGTETPVPELSDGPATAADPAMAPLDTARDAFARGDYATALAQCDKAVSGRPTDTLPHEFRALALFAVRRYQEAAGPIYAVLALGPGWDWTTMSSFYPDVDVYTGQLRALEQYVRADPDSADARFLLAYHYMTCGHPEAAVEQLKAVVQLKPSDRLSNELLKAMTATGPAKQPSPSLPAKPVAASALVGNWEAARSAGATVSLQLTRDGQYAWKSTQNGQSREFRGTYRVADNLLILNKGDAPVMVGQVTMPAADQFNFKLPGDNPSDPGLAFVK